MNPTPIAAGPYASLTVTPATPGGGAFPAATVFVADVPYVGTGDIVCTVDPNVTRAAAQRTIDLLTGMLPSLPAV